MECYIEKTRGSEWVRVELPDMGDELVGMWEHMTDANNGKTYFSGELRFKKHPLTLIGYDGCICLPRVVRDTICEQGILIEL